MTPEQSLKLNAAARRIVLDIWGTQRPRPGPEFEEIAKNLATAVVEKVKRIFSEDEP